MLNLAKVMVFSSMIVLSLSSVQESYATDQTGQWNKNAKEFTPGQGNLNIPPQQPGLKATSPDFVPGQMPIHVSPPQLVIPELHTEAGCKDALKRERYLNENFEATIGKAVNFHRYDSTKGAPIINGQDSKFDSSVVNPFNNLLSFIGTHCPYKNVVNEGNASACYFKCNGSIGVDKAGKLTDTIRLSYMKHNQQADKYHLLSLYPVEE